MLSRPARDELDRGSIAMVGTSKSAQELLISNIVAGRGL